MNPENLPESMNPSPEPVPRRLLNIFALPSQTSLLFGLTVAVLVGTVLLGSLSPSRRRSRPRKAEAERLPLVVRRPAASRSLR